jgi:low affinity Fe/Cu permease
MAPEYYELVRSYINQDASVLYSFLYAMGILAGWGIVRLIRFAWLEQLYIAMQLAAFVFLLAVLLRPAWPF